MSETTYSISLKGEQHTWLVEAWRELTFDAACAILSDLTGYRESYLRGDLPKRFDRLGYAQVKPCNAFDGEVPVFLLRSGDGSKPALTTPQPITGRADVEAVERMRRELG
jgi:hypothetical protein